MTVYCLDDLLRGNSDVWGLHAYVLVLGVLGV